METNFAYDALVRYIDSQTKRYTVADVYTELREDFGMTNEEIRSLGYTWPCLYEDEPNETREPLRKFHFDFHVSLSTVITVDAHNETEAEELAEDVAENIIYADMGCYDSGLDYLPD